MRKLVGEGELDVAILKILGPLKCFLHVYLLLVDGLLPVDDLQV